MPTSVWTVIPRGIESKDGQDVLHIGIYVSAQPNETAAVLGQPLDGKNGTGVWLEWCSNRSQDVLSSDVNKHFRLLINGETDVQKSLEITLVEPQRPQDWVSTWQDLLCYDHPNWEGQKFQAPLPSNSTNNCGSTAVLTPAHRLFATEQRQFGATHGPKIVDVSLVRPEGAEHVAPLATGPASTSSIYEMAAQGTTKPVTSHLIALDQHVGQTKAAFTVINTFSAAALHGGRAPMAGPLMEQVQSLNATVSASKQHVQKSADDIVIFLPPDPKRVTMSKAAKDCRDGLATGLKNADLKIRSRAQVIQRNLYRLSDDPFFRLDDSVFPIVEQLAEGNTTFRPEIQRKADFVRHAIFHRRCSPPELGRGKFSPTAQAGPPGLVSRAGGCGTTLGSFYRTLTLLARFPEWLERLGLAYTGTVVLPAGTKLESVTLTNLPSSGAGSAGPTPTSPVLPLAMMTACTERGYPKFLPDPEGTTFQYDGNLLLLGDSCSLVESDVDGESLRTLQQANSASLAAAAANPPPPKGVDPPDPSLSSNTNPDSALPSRSVGITLLHADSPDHQTTCLTHHVMGLRNDPSTMLGLVDLVRGYSPEILHDGKWVSLTSRNVFYNDEGNPCFQEHAPVHLEAAVHDDTPSVVGGGSVADLHLPQALFRWNGWNLTVPSPFEKAGPTVTPKISSLKFPIRARYAAKQKSQVRLRFGRTYPIRVRLVDLMGVALEPGELSSEAKEGMSLTYTRHDAVPPPELLMEGDLKLAQGETFTTLVRRENDGNLLRRRCLVPPVANFDLLMQHGMLDVRPGVIISNNGFRELKDLGSFDGVGINAVTGDFPTQMLTYSDGGTHCVPAYEAPKETLPWGTYLPDPMALLVKADVVDLATGDVYRDFPAEPFYGREKNWPHAHRLRVQMDSSTGDEPYLGWHTHPIDKVRTLMVSVPKGWHVKLRLRCVPGRDHAKLFATANVHEKFGPKLIQELQKTHPEAELPSTDAVNEALLTGHLHHYTPSRDLDFIHAVQRPIAASSVQDCGTLVQSYDSAIAEFKNVMAAIGDRRTTGKIELMAAWDDPDDTDLDRVTGAKPKHTSAELANCHLNSQLWEGKNLRNQQVFGSVTHAFPDTRYRLVTLTVNSVSRYAQYYGDDNATNEMPFITPGDEPKTVTLLSTARPDAPRVVKIIPLLPVSRKNAHKVHTLTRSGGAFRIYLDRPWYSSGYGEMLGVVLWGEGVAPGTPASTANFDSARTFVPKGGYQSWVGDSALEPFVTRWGADPARSAVVRTLAPTLANFSSPFDADGVPSKTGPTKVQCAFPAEMLVGNEDTHPENLDATKHKYVSLAAYPVKFQNRTKLYYADVQIDNLPAYNTFVRLALTRYQPDSKVNRECSPIVLAGYAQLLDGQSLVLQSLHSGQMQLDITSMQTTANCTGHENTLLVTLEYQDDGRWLPAQTQPTKKSTSPPDAENCIVTRYIFQQQHRLKRSRLIVEEYENWFVDDAKDRNVRTTRKVPRPAHIIEIPFWG